MRSDTFNKIGGFLIASAIVTACLWLGMSACISFVMWDWTSATSEPIGRFLFGFLWIAAQVVMLNPANYK